MLGTSPSKVTLHQGTCSKSNAAAKAEVAVFEKSFEMVEVISYTNKFFVKNTKRHKFFEILRFAKFTKYCIPQEQACYLE